MLLLLAAVGLAPGAAENVHAVAQLVFHDLRAPETERIVLLVHEALPVERAHVPRREEVKAERAARREEQMQPPEHLRERFGPHVVHAVKRAYRGIHGVVKIEFLRLLAEEHRRNDALRKLAELLLEHREHFRRGVHADHLVPAFGQQQRERTRAAAEIQNRMNGPAAVGKGRFIPCLQRFIRHVSGQRVIPRRERSIALAHFSSASFCSCRRRNATL